ncbi:MAG: hypothetical protein R2856_20905 [Caldilineaceae bacterium]
MSATRSQDQPPTLAGFSADRLNYIDALNMRVGVMDSTAIAMCMDMICLIC